VNVAKPITHSHITNTHITADQSFTTKPISKNLAPPEQHLLRLLAINMMMSSFDQSSDDDVSHYFGASSSSAFSSQNVSNNNEPITVTPTGPRLAFRPHYHHHYSLEDVTKSPQSIASIQLGGHYSISSSRFANDESNNAHHDPNLSPVTQTASFVPRLFLQPRTMHNNSNNTRSMLFPDDHPDKYYQSMSTTGSQSHHLHPSTRSSYCDDDSRRSYISSDIFLPDLE
jgi:hypothetical protein